MDLVQSLTWVDLAIILVLAVGVFAGFTQGTIVYVLNTLALLIAFIVAAQLKGPLIDLLGFWTAFAPEGKDLIVFMILFIGLTVAAWLVIFRVYRRSRLPIPKQLDEIGGAILGLVYVGLFITLQLVILDSFFVEGGEGPGWLTDYYNGLSESLIIGFVQDNILPIVGFVMRPFLPDEIAALL